MASKTLFQSFFGKLIPAANTRNAAGGRAYRRSPRQALAQYAATGCLSHTYYADAGEQLETVLALCEKVEPAFIARTAVFCRERGHMKDMPALLCSVLSSRSPALLSQVFGRVIDNGRMLRTFVQIMRSGATGRKSLGTRPKKLVQQWLATRGDEAIVQASVGQTPSLGDILRMVHPRPATASRKALYGYLLGRPHDAAALPAVVQAFERFKAEGGVEVPDVPFQMLTALKLGQREWTAIACRAGWQMTRMNLNTFARHGVYQVGNMAEVIAARLRDPAEVERARVFPYQLLAAYRNTGMDVPSVVREALQDAMELSLRNVPALEGKVYVLPDVSGSMSSPVTGQRGSATTAVRCIDVAALVAAAILRKNPTAEVLPFAERVKPADLNPRDSVMTNAVRLASLGGGGTNCSAPLELLNQRGAKGEVVIFISDNESWMDGARGRGTAAMKAWTGFRQRNPNARLVCIDLQPGATTQLDEREDILNVGGFSDHVFNVLQAFATGALGADHWVGEINAIPLDPL